MLEGILHKLQVWWFVYFTKMQGCEKKDIKTVTRKV